MKRRTFGAGERIFSEGDASDLAYLILRGTVDIVLSRDGDGGERVVSTLGSGEVFGEMGLIETGPRSAGAVAREETTCIAYEAEELLDMIETKPGEAAVFIRTLITRLREADRRLADK